MEIKTHNIKFFSSDSSSILCLAISTKSPSFAPSLISIRPSTHNVKKQNEGNSVSRGNADLLSRQQK